MSSIGTSAAACELNEQGIRLAARLLERVDAKTQPGASRDEIADAGALAAMAQAVVAAAQRVIE